MKGTTAEDMNYKARQGLVSETDLREWAALQNKFVVSIEWYVKTYTRPLAEDAYVVIPQLYSRIIP